MSGATAQLVKAATPPTRHALAAIIAKRLGIGIGIRTRMLRLNSVCPMDRYRIRGREVTLLTRIEDSENGAKADMEIKWIEDFIALAQYQSFSRAAEFRNVTPSGFSRSIQSLEQWVGA